MIDFFDIRNSPFGLRQVRHSDFVIRHCPAPHDATGRFDFVLANPPFNVNAVDKERLKGRTPHPNAGRRGWKHFSINRRSKWKLT